MSAPYHCLSTASSWAVMAPDALDSMTKASTLAPFQGKGADNHLDYATPQLHDPDEALLAEDVTVRDLLGERNETLCLHNDDGERVLKSSAESWEELNMAECNENCETEKIPKHAPSTTEVTDTAQSVASFGGASGVLEQERSLGVCVAQEEVEPSPLLHQEPSNTQLTASEEGSVSAPITLLMGDDLSTGLGEIKGAVQETEPEQCSSFWSRRSRNSDGLDYMCYDETERSQTVNVDPDSVISASAPSVAASRAPKEDSTEVLRRRVIHEDFMRAELESSNVSPEERVAIFHALFGDAADTPISEEKFREIMAPYKRHCECLGASYGFHHQSCWLSSEFSVSF
ncbi:hypothetical protein, unknown function [Leishmania tarentolae]|uniref:Uncharacterized protein n=1 Tax=Leishmania tarentolae TaxID=5689 RepID=A0A640KJQ3_LEITA|nr:hypothetical protein, unknown function [Leishmania tarentolae]